jgi:hypothetical protein
MPQGLISLARRGENDLQSLDDGALADDFCELLRAEFVVVAGVVGIEPGCGGGRALASAPIRLFRFFTPDDRFSCHFESVRRSGCSSLELRAALA